MARYQRHFFIGLAGILFNLNVVAAQLYSSERADGTMQFSTQSLGATYRVLPSRDVLPEPPITQRAAVAARPSAATGLIDHYAQQHAVDITLVRALVEVESRFQPTALSAKGAFGPMQLMPATARRYHVTDRANLAQNIDAGIHYLKDLLILHHGNEALALASYNAGEGAVKRHGQRIPPYRETMLYVAAVLAKAQAARNTMAPMVGQAHAAPF